MMNVGRAVSVTVSTTVHNSIRPSIDAAIDAAESAASSLNHGILVTSSYGYSCGCHLEQGCWR